jgi:hypothetical protein
MSTFTVAMGVTDSGSSLGSILLGFVAALIGGAAAVIAAVVTANKNLERERMRLNVAAQEERAQLLRDRISETFSQAFAVQHEMTWITWYAANAPDLVNQENANAYHNNVHDAFVKMQAALALVASLDLKAYEDIRPTAYELYHFETKVAKKVSGISKNRTFAISELKDLLAESQHIGDDLPLKLNAVMVAAESRSHK